MNGPWDYNFHPAGTKARKKDRTVGSGSPVEMNMSHVARIETDLEQLSRLANAGYFVGLHFRYTSPLKQYSTLPAAWTDHYMDNAYSLRDPTIAWGLSTEGVTRWSDGDIPDPFGVLDEAADFGLRYGVTISCGPVSSRTISNFALSYGEFGDDEIAELEWIVRRLHTNSQPVKTLTEAQAAALRCVADGDRQAAAAAKLRISQSAFKARLIGARQRLLARTTTEAVQRARDFRLI